MDIVSRGVVTNSVWLITPYCLDACNYLPNSSPGLDNSDIRRDPSVKVSTHGITQ